MIQYVDYFVETPMFSPHRSSHFVFQLHADDRSIVAICLFTEDGIEFFSSFDVFTLELLLSIVRKNTYKTHQDILTQGQRAEALHVIYAGQVDVLIDGLAVSRLGSQSILGERSICALGEEISPCAATIRPVTSVVITYSWPRTSLLELFMRDDRIYEPWPISWLCRKDSDTEIPGFGINVVLQMFLDSLIPLYLLIFEFQWTGI